MIYDQNGNRVRLKSERSRRLHALDTALSDASAKLVRTRAVHALLRNAAGEHPDVPEYAQARDRADQRLRLAEGHVHQIKLALAAWIAELEGPKPPRIREGLKAKAQALGYTNAEIALMESRQP